MAYNNDICQISPMITASCTSISTCVQVHILVALYIYAIYFARNLFLLILLSNGASNFKRSPPGCVAQSIGHLTRKSGVLGSIPGLATYFGFSFRFFKQGSCQLLAKVCARSTG